MLLVDVNQPKSDIEAIAACPAWQTAERTWQVSKLTHGDYAMNFYSRKTKTWHTTEVWESKTWADLQASLSSKRLLQQLLKMQAAYPNGSGLLISDEPLATWTFETNPLSRQVRTFSATGSWRDSPYTVSALRGFLLTVQSRGIRVVETHQHGGLGYCLDFLHKHAESHRDDKDHFYRGRAAVPIAMLDVIPRITPETAARIYESACEVMGAKPESGSIEPVTHLSETALIELAGPLAGKELWSRLH